MKITKEQLKQMIKEEIEAIMVKEEMSDKKWVQLLKDIREFAEGEANMVAHEPMGHHMVAEKIMDEYRDQLMKVVDEERMENIAYNIAWKAAKGYDEY